MKNMAGRAIKLAAALGLLAICTGQASAQIGGKREFELMNLPWSGRLAGLGGKNVSALGNDPSMMVFSPIHLQPETHGQLSYNYNSYFANISPQLLSYAHAIDSLNVVGLTAGTISYGSFKGYDPGGNATNNFTAGDLLLQGSYSRRQGPFTLGASLKYASSRIETYNASALAVDLGSVWKHPERQFTVGLTVRNLGFGFNNYGADESARLPLDVVLGTSYRLEHMPFRVSVTAHRLDQWDIAYLDPSSGRQLDASGNPIVPKKTVGDIALRHFVFGGELFLGKFLTVRGGYNHLVNRELRLEDARSGAGFSFGVSLKLGAFDFAYNQGLYHMAGSANYFSIMLNMPRLVNKFSKSGKNEG